MLRDEAELDAQRFMKACLEFKEDPDDLLYRLVNSSVSVGQTGCFSCGDYARPEVHLYTLMRPHMRMHASQSAHA